MRAGPDLRSGFLRPAPAVPAAVKSGRGCRRLRAVANRTAVRTLSRKTLFPQYEIRYFRINIAVLNVLS